ncbi:MAG TPA: hypothetical protein VIV11_37760 [Kofleriaceae bacterium]
MRATGMAVAQLVLAIVAAASTPASKADVHSRGVNLYVGDLSAVFGYVPALDGLDPASAERARVRGHLLFAHDILASVDTSTWSADRRAARARNLERLRVYAQAGEFPHNDDHADTYRPTFVDKAGTLCAVGALLAADRGRGAAERIAAADKYGFVAQLQDPELAAWQQTSGLSVAELGLIQPTYDDPPDSVTHKVWLPFGLLDRVQIAPPRFSATTEMTSADRFDSATTTLHAQASTSCDCKIGGYGTLPISINLAEAPSGVAMAPGPFRMDSRTALGTAEIGVFGGSEKYTGDQTIYRLGILLPTASREQGRLFPSARVGDAVLELPRTAGVRISSSMLQRWRSFPGRDSGAAMRADIGLDVAVEYANEVHDRIVHVMPRVGLGSMIATDATTWSFDTALSVDPLVDFEPKLRWSAGVTGRLASRDGNGWRVMPGLTLATVRTPEGWAGTLSLDLAISGRAKPRYNGG